MLARDIATLLIILERPPESFAARGDPSDAIRMRGTPNKSRFLRRFDNRVVEVASASDFCPGLPEQPRKNEAVKVRTVPQI